MSFCEERRLGLSARSSPIVTGLPASRPPGLPGTRPSLLAASAPGAAIVPPGFAQGANAPEGCHKIRGTIPRSTDVTRTTAASPADGGPARDGDDGRFPRAITLAGTPMHRDPPTTSPTADPVPGGRTR